MELRNEVRIKDGVGQGTSRGGWGAGTARGRRSGLAYHGAESPRAAARLGQRGDGSLNSAPPAAGAPPGPDHSLEGDQGQDGSLPAKHLPWALGSATPWDPWAQPTGRDRLSRGISTSPRAAVASGAKGPRRRKGPGAKDTRRGEACSQLGRPGLGPGRSGRGPRGRREPRVTPPGGPVLSQRRRVDSREKVTPSSHRDPGQHDHGLQCAPVSSGHPRHPALPGLAPCARG